MNIRGSFNTLFSKGFSFEHYKTRSDRQLGRMKVAWEAIEEELGSVTENRIKLINQSLKVLCIAENWCGDCGNTVPVISRMADKFHRWDFKIIGKDDIDEQSSQLYLSEGKPKIPLIIVADEEGNEILRWTERPKNSYLLISQLKEQKLDHDLYVAQFKSNPDLQPEKVAKAVLNDLLDITEKAGAIVYISSFNKK